MDIINYILILILIIVTAYYGARFTKQGLSDNWYENLRKPSWSPEPSLIREIWFFIYVVTGLAVLWYWNVPVFSWMHYVTAGVLLVNLYLNATWSRTFFIERDLQKAYKHINKLNATTIIATILMYFASPIASGLMLPYIIWVSIATYMTKRITDMNQK